MRKFFPQLKAYLIAPIRVVSVISVALLLGITGPFGTYFSLTFGERMLYWGLLVCISGVIAQVVKVLVNMWVPTLSQGCKSLLAAIVLTIVLTPLLVFQTKIMVGHKMLVPISVWVYASLTFTLTGLVFFIQMLLKRSPFQARARIFSRFDDPRIQSVQWITVRDHYVDILTDRGTQTLLMRFSDALSELGNIAGLQVHRSHWVAVSAVKELTRQDGRGKILLKDGTEIPVSRGYLADAEEQLGQAPQGPGNGGIW